MGTLSGWESYVMRFRSLNLACGFHGHILGQSEEVFGGVYCGSVGGTAAVRSVVGTTGGPAERQCFGASVARAYHLYHRCRQFPVSQGSTWTLKGDSSSGRSSL